LRLLIAMIYHTNTRRLSKAEGGQGVTSSSSVAEALPLPGPGKARILLWW
jgi:hypothetical protein